MVGEVRLACSIQPGHRGHQVVVHPQSTHGVVHRGVNLHRRLVRIIGCNLLVHVEQVAILRLDHFLSELGDFSLRGVAQSANVRFCFAVALNRARVIQEHRLTRLVHAESSIATLLGSTRRNVPGNEVSEGWVTALQVVVSVFFRDIICAHGAFADCFRVFLFGRHPDAAVVAQRLRHERQLGLVLSGHRNARRMNLREAGIRHVRPFLVRLPSRGDVGAHGVGAQEKDVAIAP